MTFEDRQMFMEMFGRTDLHPPHREQDWGKLDLKTASWILTGEQALDMHHRKLSCSAKIKSV
ncbi:MAG: hypothetical protein CL912_01960 [Deltaproteobacteria bacterium]|nr:hypothetical protein [Deltaproteobacteria bacterium]